MGPGDYMGSSWASRENQITSPPTCTLIECHLTWKLFSMSRKLCLYIYDFDRHNIIW